MPTTRIDQQKAREWLQGVSAGSNNDEAAYAVTLLNWIAELHRANEDIRRLVPPDPSEDVTTIQTDRDVMIQVRFRAKGGRVSVSELPNETLD